MSKRYLHRLLTPHYRAISYYKYSAKQEPFINCLISGTFIVEPLHSMFLRYFLLAQNYAFHSSLFLFCFSGSWFFGEGVFFLCQLVESYTFTYSIFFCRSSLVTFLMFPGLQVTTFFYDDYIFMFHGSWPPPSSTPSFSYSFCILPIMPSRPCICEHLHPY